MKIRTKYVAVLLLMVGSLSGKAQQYLDLLKLDYSISQGKFSGTNTTNQVNELAADLSLPVVLSEGNVLVTGVIYENISTSVYDGSPAIKLQAINLKIGFNKTWSESFSSTVVLLPKLASDFGGKSPENFQMGGVALFKKTKNENLNYKFGLYVNGEVFGMLVVPIAGIYYNSETWEININLPMNSDISYRLSKNIKIGTRYEGLIKSFNFNSPYLSKDVYLAKSHNEGGLYLQAALGPVQARIFGGLSVGRSYRVYENGDEISWALTALKFGDNRTQLNTDFSNGLLFKASLIYRIDLTKKGEE